MAKCAERFEDMSERGRLRVWQQDDGDMIVHVIPDPSTDNRGASVEFCVSGGRSPRTLEALRQLLVAIHADNCDSALAARRGRFQENMPHEVRLPETGKTGDPSVDPGTVCPC